MELWLTIQKYYEMIDANPFERVRKNLGKFFKNKKKPADETQVYNNEEIQALENQEMKPYKQF